MKNIILSRRMKALLMVLVVLLIATFYYFVVYRMYKDAMQTYDTSDLETEMTTEQAKSLSLKKMEDYLNSHSDVTYGAVAPYNNLSNEVLALGNLLNSSAGDINISWSDPTVTDKTVRRVASISFTCGNYDTARTIINNITNFPYRCIISDLEISSAENNVSSSQVSVTMNVTFFETTENAANLQGLKKADSDSSQNSDSSQSSSSSSGSN